MKLCKTARFKLDVSVEEVLPTVKAYTNAFNLVCQIGYAANNHNAIELHKLTYKDCRDNFKLPSQLAISARTKAVEALKSIKKNKYARCPKSKLSSIRLDCNSYSISKTNVVSILTLDGRKKFQLNIPQYYSQFFVDWKHTSADLVVRKNSVFLHISFEKEITDTKQSGKFLGVDRGLKKIAVTSDNKFYSADKLVEVCQRYKTLRSNLQKKGTKSAKRHLRKLSGKEKRFKADVNHQISKQITSSLKPGDTVALENLKNIRYKKARKEHRTKLNSWSYFQLEQFITYKAIAKGVHVVKVNPAYTSQKCSKCEHIDEKSRVSQAEFCCTSCKFKLNADLNASRNISSRALASYMLANGAVVNQPIVSAATSGTSPHL